MEERDMEERDLRFGQAEASLWVKWVFANFLASLFVAVPGVLVPRYAKGELATILASLIFWPFGILILAAMQWLVLRRWLPRARGWLVATVAGAFMYLVLFGPATTVVTGISDTLAQTSNAAWAGLAELWSAVAAGALLGAAIGLAQWMVLGRLFSRAGWWILATTVGWAVAGVSQQTFDCLAILTGFAPSALTGAVLVWLVRPTLGDEAKPVPRSAPKERPKMQTCPHCREQVSSRAVLCRHCKGWLVDGPQALEVGEKPAKEFAHAERQGGLWGMLLAIVLGTLASLALPVAALVARAAACGPLHSSVIIFAAMALVFCVPAAALPAALAWTMGRRRPDGWSEDGGRFSLPRALFGGLLGAIISSAVSAVCACMTFSPECL
jgi:hypothetical protein